MYFFNFKKSFIFAVFLIPFFLSSSYAEDVNLSTYYPSPYGNYRRLQIEEASDPALATFRGGVTRAGLQIISTYVNGGNYIPGIFWSTSDNNPLRPKAGIWMFQENDATSGSKLLFGTSNDYATGITNTGMVLDSDGDLGLGTDIPNTRLHVSREDGATDQVTNVLTVHHGSTGVPSAGFGPGILFAGESSSVGARDMARIQSVWTDANDGTRSSSLQFQTVGNAGALANRMTIDGSGNTDFPSDGATLRIPRKSTAGDPAGGQEGMIYYSDSTNRFRMFQGGGWADLVPTGGDRYIGSVVAYKDPDANTVAFTKPTTARYAVVKVMGGGNDANLSGAAEDNEFMNIILNFETARSTGTHMWVGGNGNAYMFNYGWNNRPFGARVPVDVGEIVVGAYNTVTRPRIDVDLAGTTVTISFLSSTNWDQSYFVMYYA